MSDPLSSVASSPTREQLGQLTSDQRLILALESLFQQSNINLPTDVQTLLDEIAIVADAVNNGTFVIAAPDIHLISARVLVAASTGLSINLTAPKQVRILLNALANLNALASIAFTKPITMGAGLAVIGGVITDTLQVNQAATVSVTASDHSIPINVNGTVMYMRLSATP